MMTVYDIADVATANESPDYNRRFAERVLTRVDRHSGFAWEQVASFAKWLSASLLAINGAGGLAALALVRDHGGSVLPPVLFGLGMLLALLSGTALQEIYNNLAEPLLEHDNYWTSVVIDGVRDGDIEEKLEAETKKGRRFSYIPPLLGWCSGISFIAGSIALALASGSIGSASKAACLSLEQDMLQAKPQRPNGPELFNALGCKASGRTELSQASGD
jgi:hypothetical protein